MRILFCQGGERWKIDDCGKAYTSGSFDERIWERYKLYGSELTVMFAEERKRYNSGLLPTKYNFFDETKYIHGECVVLSVWFVYQLNYNTGRPIRLSFYHLL